jgi:hypothetical protein
MSHSPLQEFREQILVAPYPDLEPHLRRGALILVDVGLDLAEIALQVSANNEAAIGGLIANGRLARPGPEALETWRTEKAFFQFLIVQPFVLAQRFVPEAR